MLRLRTSGLRHGWSVHRKGECACRDMDVGMMLALLAAISRASCEERLAAAYRLLLWQSGGALLPRRLAVAYVRLLKVRRCAQHAHRQAHAHFVLIS